MITFLGIGEGSVVLVLMEGSAKESLRLDFFHTQQIEQHIVTNPERAVKSICLTLKQCVNHCEQLHN